MWKNEETRHATKPTRSRCVIIWIKLNYNALPYTWLCDAIKRSYLTVQCNRIVVSNKRVATCVKQLSKFLRKVGFTCYKMFYRNHYEKTDKLIFLIQLEILFWILFLILKFLGYSAADFKISSDWERKTIAGWFWLNIIIWKNSCCRALIKFYL